MRREVLGVEAKSRCGTGKSIARKLRRNGQIPGVVYGLDSNPRPIAVSVDTVKRLMRVGHTVLVDLSIDGRPPEQGVAAIVKAIQRHPVTWQPESIDFQWVSLSEAVHVSVPVAIVGEALGAMRDNGTVEQLLHEIEVRCLPTAIPDVIEVDVSQMLVGDVLHVRDLAVPEGVTVLTDPEEAVVTCVAARVAEVGAEGEAEAAEALQGKLAESEQAGDEEADES
jgi:large subunit ribosomal protein L25